MPIGGNADVGRQPGRTMTISIIAIQAMVAASTGVIWSHDFNLIPDTSLILHLAQITQSDVTSRARRVVNRLN